LQNDQVYQGSILEVHVFRFMVVFTLDPP